MKRLKIDYKYATYMNTYLGCIDNKFDKDELLSEIEVDNCRLRLYYSKGKRCKLVYISGSNKINGMVELKSEIDFKTFLMNFYDNENGRYGGEFGKNLSLVKFLLTERDKAYFVYNGIKIVTLSDPNQLFLIYADEKRTPILECDMEPWTDVQSVIDFMKRSSNGIEVEVIKLNNLERVGTLSIDSNNNSTYRTIEECDKSKGFTNPHPQLLNSFSKNRSSKSISFKTITIETICKMFDCSVEEVLFRFKPYELEEKDLRS